MIFKFAIVPVQRPAVPLGNATARPRPLLWVGFARPGGGPRVFKELWVDTGSDDTLVSLDLATDIGLNLRGVPTAFCYTATGQRTPVRYAEVELTLAAAANHFVRWRATIGFAPVARPVFGFAGGLQFFHTSFDWAAGRFALAPRADLPLADAAFPGPAAAVRIPA